MEIFFIFDCVKCDEEIKHSVLNMDGKPELHLMCIENITVTCPRCGTENCLCEMPILDADSL